MLYDFGCDILGIFALSIFEFFKGFVDFFNCDSGELCLLVRFVGCFAFVFVVGGPLHE